MDGDHFPIRLFFVSWLCLLGTSSVFPLSFSTQFLSVQSLPSFLGHLFFPLSYFRPFSFAFHLFLAILYFILLCALQASLRETKSSSGSPSPRKPRSRSSSRSRSCSSARSYDDGLSTVVSPASSTLNASSSFSSGYCEDISSHLKNIVLVYLDHDHDPNHGALLRPPHPLLCVLHLSIQNQLALLLLLLPALFRLSPHLPLPFPILIQLRNQLPSSLIDPSILKIAPERVAPFLTHGLRPIQLYLVMMMIYLYMWNGKIVISRHTFFPFNFYSCSKASSS